LIIMLVAAGGLAFVYGVDMKGAADWAQQNPGVLPPSPDAVLARAAIAAAAAMYTFERIGRHLVENRPFPE